MPLKKLKKRDHEENKKFLKAIGCIAVGTIAGIITYYVCLFTHFDIFGWNFGLVLSPLAAGYVETYFANKYLKETTGAVSAFILFIITVVWGFFLSNPTLGFNVITAGSIIIILQAAIPTAINYFLFAMILGIISYASGVFKKITDRVWEIYLEITGKDKPKPNIRQQKKDYFKKIDKIEPSELGLVFLTTSHPPQNIKIKEYKGIYEGRSIVESDQRTELKLRGEELERYLFEILDYAKREAILEIAKELKKDKCNGVIDLEIDYEIMGFQGSDKILQLSITGTGVIIETE